MGFKEYNFRNENGYQYRIAKIIKGESNDVCVCMQGYQGI